MSKPADRIYNDSAGERDAPPSAIDADPTERTDFPCSVAQERFWLLDRLDPGNAAYNVAVRWRLEGRVATDLLERAWLALIERHEILRTQFFEADGVAMQRIMPHSPFKLAEIDLSTLPADQQQIEADRIGVIEARAPFDLGSGPMVRATLLRFAPTVSIILVTTHQIVSDGWSIGVMAREMGMLYDALRHDRESPLPPLPIQYADYSLWQLEWLRVRGTAAETEYWTKQLAGVKSFKVIADHPRPAMPTTNGAIVSRVLPRDLTNRAQALTAERGATLFAGALAALCAMLARYTAEGEIVIGTQVSDRDQVELESMVGQFVNSLILRTDLSDDPRFELLIDRVREMTSQALEHRHIPIERLLGMIKGGRTHARSAAISVNFIFQKTFIQNASYGDFTLTDMPSLPAGAIYDLNFFMVERPDGWRISCQCNTDQFDESTAARMLAYIETLFDNAVANPQRRISELTLTAANDARLLYGKLNDTRALYPRDLTLAQLFEAQAARAAEAVAVVHEDQQLSYGELNIRAERVADYLRAQGVAPGATVAVCLARSLELPIALLAVLKVGATWLPIDAADSPERRALLLAAAKTRAVIHSGAAGEAERAFNPIAIEAALAAAAGARGKAPEAETGTAACLLFAATEIAAPVRISHRSLANLVFSMTKRPGFSERDVLVATCPQGQPQSILELLLPLLTGARLIIATDKDLGNGRRMLHLLQRVGATVMYAMPTLWSRILEAGWIGFPALKMLYPSQTMRHALFERLSAIGGELWALYGQPGIIASAALRVRTKEDLSTLGAPVANTVLYVLDARNQLAAVGATGVLYVGGDGLGDGGGDLASDPSGASTPLRLLRTGDRGRLKSTGQVQLIGRHDAFSLRGSQIDRSALETALRGHPSVADVAILADDDDALVVYAVPRSALGSKAFSDLLQSELAHRLTHHLLPARIEVRESLPRAANAELDYRALAAPKAPPAAERNAENSTINAQLTGVWSTMLGRDVGPEDNFFELGGHSLLAARMLAQVERLFGRRIKLATLFSAPTIRELAAVLSHADMREFDFRQVVKIQPHGSRPPLIGINNTGIYYGLAKRLGADQPVISLQLFDPSVPTADLPDSLEGIAAGYVSLIRRVQPQGPYELMGWCVAGALSFEIARQLEALHHQVAHLFLIDSWVPRYFERQSMLRGLIGDYSLRWQLVADDWRKFRRGGQTLGEFIANRTIVKRVKRALGRPADEAPRDRVDLEIYDQWLLGYLQAVTRKYEPQRIDAPLVIIRSREEPTGWLFKEDAGWSAYTARSAQVVYVDGNHFTMFADPGAVQLAAHMSTALTSTP